MMHLSAFGAYQLYMSLRSHFMTDSYDFFKYRGRMTQLSHKKYVERGDKQYFEMVSRTLEFKQLKELYISHFLEDRYYPADFIMEDATDIYKEHQKHIQSLTYNFSEDLNKLVEKGLHNCFRVDEHTYPYIALLYMRKSISIETVVILDNMLHFMDKFDEFYKGDVIWKKISRKVRKYKPFLKYDRDKMREILKEVMNKQKELN